MEPLFEHLNHWHWWILAVVLLVLEILAPGIFFLWMSISAGLVGVLVLLAPGVDWEYQVFVFAVLSVASIAVWRAWFRTPPVTDQPTLNRRGEQYIGRHFTLVEPIVNGQGKIRVDDSTWKIRGEDCPAGSRIEVKGVDGVVLTIDVIQPDNQGGDV